MQFQAESTCKSLMASAAILLAAWSTGINANGWEHTTVPFDDLVRAIEFDDPATRARAAKSLGVRAQREAAGPLTNRLHREGNQQVRAAIYIALGKLPSEGSESVLLRCLENLEEAGKVRAVCAQSLGKLGTPAALASLLVATHDVSLPVRSRAVDALGYFTDPFAIRRLAEIYGENNTVLALRALNALARSGSPLAAAPLLKALQTTRDEVEKLLIVKGLGTSGSVEAVGALKSIKQHSRNPVVQTAAVVSLGAINHQDRYTLLAGFLEDPVPAVRFVALHRLRELGDPRSAAAIIKLAKGNMANFRGLTQIDMAAQLLQSLALISEQLVAIEALSELDPKSAVKVLLQSARLAGIRIESSIDAELAAAIYRLKRAALYGLGYTASDQATQFLAGPGGLGQVDFRLRSTAVRSIGVLGRPVAISAVTPMLQDDSPEVRWTTAMVLGLLGGEKAIPALQGALKDADARVRTEAARALGHLKASSARTTLQRLSSDPSEQVRQAARFSTQLIDQAGQE